jgi:hypothetical protein
LHVAFEELGQLSCGGAAVLAEPHQTRQRAQVQGDLTQHARQADVTVDGNYAVEIERQILRGSVADGADADHARAQRGSMRENFAAFHVYGISALAKLVLFTRAQHHVVHGPQQRYDPRATAFRKIGHLGIASQLRLSRDIFNHTWRNNITDRMRHL